jgi:ABC-type polar amino acid transport system ATPase subunit
MIQTFELTKRYGTLSVLKGISLRVERGEVAVIVGPSGGGKSTFLRCLNGLESFQDGSLDIAGVNLSPYLQHGERNRRLGEIRRQVGMVFQQFNLFPHRTVLGNVIEAPCMVLGQPREQAEAMARQLLERVGLGAKLHVMPDTLSGGQQQRVAIARALAMQPKAILFDEPTSALDPRMAAEVESVITDLAKEGQTMIVVTHSMRLARRAANTLYVFEGGHILEHGPPEQIFDAPQQEATRLFLNEADGK